ncbi:hypothetical protein A7G45_31625 [Mycolicibacterium llatzerense]|nr:hypothetical protein [Mycolicibacterium llatzerense]
MDPPDLEQLYRAYVQRMKAHPPSTWSSSLLSIVISAVDLQFGDSVGGDSVGRSSGRGLHIVR